MRRKLSTMVGKNNVLFDSHFSNGLSTAKEKAEEALAKSGEY